MTNTLKTASLALLSIILLITGGMLVYEDFVPKPRLNFQAKKLALESLGKLPTRYTIKSLTEYTVGRDDHTDLFHLTVARYSDETGEHRQAMIFPSNSESEGPVLNPNELRHRVWTQAAQAIQQYVDKNAIFFTWWDNAQRLHLLTGMDAWVDAPVEQAFSINAEQDFWRQVGGDFDTDNKRLTQLAEWLLMDANEGLQRIKQELSTDQSSYFMMSLDDLARLQELTALTGRPNSLESKVFRSTDNIHNLINQVKRWSKEGGTGNYLVQPIPGVGVRAWRITDSKAENLLLVRLLPFTHSLAKPLVNITMVYRSEWGGYLSIFKLDS
jgi:hydroxylamine oxidation protein HaoB